MQSHMSHTSHITYLENANLLKANSFYWKIQNFVLSFPPSPSHPCFVFFFFFFNIWT